MCLQVCSHIQNCRAAGAIVHGPIINFVAVDGRADAHVIDVRGEDHVFIFQRGIGAGKFGNQVRGFDGTGFDGRFGAERNRERKMWQRLAVFAERGDFRESVAGTREEFFGGGGIAGDTNLLTGSFQEFGIGKVHGRLVVVRGNPRPGNVHRGGIENGDGTDDAGCMKRFPAFACGLVVRGESGGNVRWRTGEIDNDFPVEVEAGEFIEILFRNF